MVDFKTLYTVHTRGSFKRKLYVMAKIIVFFIILIMILVFTYNITKRKYSYTKNADFFSQKEEFDVLFFGSSHMYTEIYPMQLWKKYGIVSYNLGQSSSTIAISYNNMLLALKYKHPKLIVLDVYMIESNNKIRAESFINSMHYTFDAYPISYNKYQSIKDLCGNENLLNYEAEFLFNFSIYHSRWKELKKEDFYIVNKCEKGAETRIAVEPQDKINDFSLVCNYTEETINMKYLRKFIEYCKENDINVLLTDMPYPARKEEIIASKYVQNIADEYNIKYINFLNMNIEDYKTDGYDSNHLNASGARKVTDYIGQYIMENYDIQDQRENNDYSFWYEDYNRYINFKISNLAANEKNINNYLMLLYGEEDISYKIKISSKQEIKEGTILQRLLANIGNNYEIDDSVFINNSDKTMKITTWDNRTGKEIKTVWF